MARFDYNSILCYVRALWVRFVTLFNSKPQQTGQGRERKKDVGQSELIGDGIQFAYIDPKTLDYDFDTIEHSILYESIGFGNPHSKLTPHEQFLLWKRMIQQGLFLSRDEFLSKMATI